MGHEVSLPLDRLVAHHVVCGQPIGGGGAAGVGAGSPDVTEHEGHGAEALKT